MRNYAWLVALMLIAAVTACSEDSLAVEIVQPQAHEGALPFTASGPALSDGVICSAGTVQVQRLESMEGDPLTDDDWAGMFDAALEEEGVAEMYVFEEYVCGDGSGTFVLKWHNRFDFATFEFGGQQDVGTWEVDQGTGSYVDMSGSGDITLDWDNGETVLSGDVGS